VCDTQNPFSQAIKHRPDSRKGHEKLESTNKYLHADLTIKERALARTAPQKGTRRPARYRPKDKLLTFLEGL
jgi:hypothetical protein